MILKGRVLAIPPMEGVLVKGKNNDAIHFSCDLAIRLNLVAGDEDVEIEVRRVDK